MEYKSFRNVCDTVPFTIFKPCMYINHIGLIVQLSAFIPLKLFIDCSHKKICFLYIWKNK